MRKMREKREIDGERRTKKKSNLNGPVSSPTKNAKNKTKIRLLITIIILLLLLIIIEISCNT